MTSKFDIEVIKKFLIISLEGTARLRRYNSDDDYDAVQGGNWSLNYYRFLSWMMRFVCRKIEDGALDDCTALDQVRDIVFELLEVPMKERDEDYLKSKGTLGSTAERFQRVQEDLKKGIVQKNELEKRIKIYPAGEELTQKMVVNEMLKDMDYSLICYAEREKSDLLYALAESLEKRIGYRAPSRLPRPYN